MLVLVCYIRHAASQCPTQWRDRCVNCQHAKEPGKRWDDIVSILLCFRHLILQESWLSLAVCVKCARERDDNGGAFLVLNWMSTACLGQSLRRHPIKLTREDVHVWAIPSILRVQFMGAYWAYRVNKAIANFAETNKSRHLRVVNSHELCVQVFKNSLM